MKPHLILAALSTVVFIGSSLAEEAPKAPNPPAAAPAKEAPKPEAKKSGASKILDELMNPTPQDASKPDPKPLVKGITVKSVFEKIDPKTGKADRLSAPTVIARDKQKCKIEVGNEAKLTLPGTNASQEYRTGIEMELTPTLLDGDVVLNGVAIVREQVKDSGKSGPNEAWTVVKAHEVNFVLRSKPGMESQLKLGAGDEQLNIRLTADLAMGVNAATLYWQAFAAMPKLSDAEKTLFNKLNPNGTDEAAKQLAAKYGAALELMHKAAAEDDCDWNLDFSKGPGMLLPHLSKLQELGRAAGFRAQVRFAAKDNKGALTDLVDALRLSRHAAI